MKRKSEIVRERTNIIKRLVKDQIKKKGLSIAGVANKLSTHKNFLSQAKGFTITRIYDIAEAIDCNVYDILPKNKEDILF